LERKAWQAPFAERALYTFRDAHSDPSDRDAALPGGLDHGKMRGLLGYSLAQAAIPSLKIFNKRIGEPFQLRRIDFTILMLVASNPHVTQRQMSLALDVSAPRLTLVCDKLVERGLSHAHSAARKTAASRPSRDAQGAGALVKKSRSGSRRDGERVARSPERGRARAVVQLLEKVARHRRV
jgi:MarR family transcriptional regulator for hemolysin